MSNLQTQKPDGADQEDNWSVYYSAFEEIQLGGCMKIPVRFPYCLVLISGPPRSGKNRAGGCLAGRLDADHFALSNSLKRQTHNHYRLGADLGPLTFEDCKDQPMPQFGGLTPREAYILYSETVMKPLHGKDCLGRQAVERVRRNKASGRISLISGVGFLDEVRPLIEEAKGKSTLHIQVLPVKQDVHGDSREKLSLSFLGVQEVEVENHGCSAFLDALQRALPQVEL